MSESENVPQVEAATGPNPFYISERARGVFESRPVNDMLKIDLIKRKAALLFDEIDSISVPPGNNEAGRLLSLAKTDLESSVMWAVKAVSRT